MKRLTYLALCCSLLLSACEQQVDVSSEPPLRPVRIAVVANTDGARERSFSGISQSTQESRLSFKVNGTLVELPVQVGDRLKKGDLIAALSGSTYELQVQQAEAALAQAQANQRNADANYERVKGLYENSNASRNDLDVARANAESAQAQVRSARKSLEIAQLNRSYTRLRAAADCTVASIDADLNENVNAGEQIAKVNCGGGIEVSLGIPESLIGGFTANMPARIRFNALPDREFIGQVTEVGVASGSNATTFPVIVTLTEFDPAVRPSMAAEVTLKFSGVQPTGQLIPAAAVIKDERGTFVYVAEPAEGNQASIRRQAVAVGELTANGIEILSGLSEGDRVVTAGTSVIREQQTVLLPEN